MPGRQSEYRPSYTRNRHTRRETPGDAITLALSAQILLCAVLLVVAHIAKKADESGYGGIRERYHVLVTDEGQNAEAVEYFRQFGSAAARWIDGLEQLLSNAVRSFSGEGAQPRADGGGEREDAFGYNYLPSDGNIEFTSAAPLGQGGWNPVRAEGGTGLSAPEGAALSPVLLGGRIKPPVTGPVTSAYSYRSHPITGETDFHTGIDIAAEEGRAVLAALPGTVAEAGENDIYGNYIVLEHAANLRTFYAHCSELIAREGMAVRQGERIAKVGRTGVVTGPHLHFSVIVEEKYTDPYWVLGGNIRLVE